MEGDRRKEESVGITDELIAAFLDGNVSGEEMEPISEEPIWTSEEMSARLIAISNL